MTESNSYIRLWKYFRRQACDFHVSKLDTLKIIDSQSLKVWQDLVQNVKYNLGHNGQQNYFFFTSLIQSVYDIIILYGPPLIVSIQNRKQTHKKMRIANLPQLWTASLLLGNCKKSMLFKTSKYITLTYSSGKTSL